MMSAPASRNCPWISAITSGRVSVSRSLLPFSGVVWPPNRVPRKSASSSACCWIIVPIAPSSRSTRWARARSRTSRASGRCGIVSKRILRDLGRAASCTPAPLPPVDEYLLRDRARPSASMATTTSSSTACRAATTRCCASGSPSRSSRPGSRGRSSCAAGRASAIAFGGFAPAHVAALGDARLRERLVTDARVIRNRRKIEAIIANAAVMCEMIATHGSVAGVAGCPASAAQG